MGLGLIEIAVICLAALIFVGPRKLPELARSIGRGVRQFRKGMQDLERAVEDTVSVKQTASRESPAHDKTPSKAEETDTHPQNTP